jgi:3-phenylpropionate/trans-cinnamate dioxygenase ferredoxin component
MAEAVRVGAVTDFEDGYPLRFDVGGEDVAVVKWRGRFFAFSNKCTHWGTSLAEGYINGAGQIVCLYHDSAFDIRSGAVMGGPAPEDLRVYRAEVEGEDVLVSEYEA